MKDHTSMLKNYLIWRISFSMHSCSYLVPKPSSQNDSEVGSHNFKEMKFRAGRVKSKLLSEFKELILK